MQPLEYKNIAGEEHLTFHSIRRLVHKELSELSAREAQKHVDSCTRCQGIYTSLTSPDQVIESRGHKYVVRPMIMGLLLVVLLVGTAASILYFGSENKPSPDKKAESPIVTGVNPENFPEVPQEIPEVDESAPVLEAIDTLAQINEEPSIEAPLPTNKQFDQYIEKEQSQPRTKLWGIYGKITAGGQPLPGVTVMVPGSRSGRVSDEGGKYYIQVPKSTKSLIFIYRGKQLVKELDPNSRRLDIYLKSRSLSYPDIQDADNQAKVES